MDQKQILIFVCIALFALTGIITLLGIINLLKIKEGFLNKLFTSLILQIVAIGIVGFGTFIKDNNTDDVIIIDTKISFKDIDGNLINEEGQETLSEQLDRTRGITVVPNYIKNGNNFQIYIPKSFIKNRSAGINIGGLKNFNQIPITNNILKKKLNEIKDNTINLDEIILKQIVK